MRAALCTLLVWSSVAAAADVKYGVSARSELRARTPLPGDTGTVLTGDLELDPVVDLAVLFHTGGRGMFPLVAEAVATVIPVEDVRWISFGHVESGLGQRLAGGGRQAGEHCPRVAPGARGV